MSDVTNILKPYDELIRRFYAGDETSAYLLFGSHPYEDGWRFVLWAPNAKSVHVAGDWSDWDEEAHPMDRYKGIWAVYIPEADHGDLYKYIIEGADGKIRYKSDPYAFRCEMPPGTASQLWDTTGYEWKDAAYRKRAGQQPHILKRPVSVYELHLASWKVDDATAKEGHTGQDGTLYPSYRELAHALADYVKDMGYTHIEIMPVNEFPFDGSWGYQITGFFAITSRFGTPQDFIYFVDIMHANNIGVIMDWVPSGFPKDAHGLSELDGTRLYEHLPKLRRELPGWGTNAFNFGRPEVVSFLVSSAVQLMDVYHLDGLRVDAVSAMLYLDYGREEYIPNKDGGNIDYDAVALLRKLNTAVMRQYPGTFTVAEESTSFPLVTKPSYDGGLGFMFKWNMGYMNDTLDYMRTDPLYRKGAHSKMTFSMHYAFSENYVLAYSHDEVVHGKASMLGKMSAPWEGKFDSLRALYAWQYAHPGKKLSFMGNEFAQVIEWNYKQELDWLLLDYEKHRGMQAFIRELNRVYKKHEPLFADTEEWEGFTWLNVDDSAHSVFAFERKSAGGSRIVCVFNFTPVLRRGYKVALPGPGALRLILNSDDSQYGGAGGAGGASAALKKNVKTAENGAELTLPPLSAQYYIYNSQT
ncbi:MAG: 1,4-alpha-glucan branching protein GlgB [Clostridiales Family XIII bacterium]|jgi:1,4-alpha-glucan branching enzyme|nr:1,4-alpha-glucan branching protein GlgB [Clostridiales Family XIII bacterium]